MVQLSEMVGAQLLVGVSYLDEAGDIQSTFTSAVE